MDSPPSNESVSHRKTLGNAVSFRKNLIDVSSINSSKLQNILNTPTSRRGPQRRWSNPYAYYDNIQYEISLSESSRSSEESIKDDIYMSESSSILEESISEEHNRCISLLENDPHFREVDGFFELVDFSDTQKKRGFLVNHLDTCKSIMWRRITS